VVVQVVRSKARQCCKTCPYSLHTMKIRSAVLHLLHAYRQTRGQSDFNMRPAGIVSRQIKWLSEGWTTEVWSPAGARIFLVVTTSTKPIGTPSTSMGLVLSSSFSKVMRQESKAYHSVAYTADINNAWSPISTTSISLRVLVFRHKDNFTLALFLTRNWQRNEM
jgi:REP element-mobilizing transposase RayT